MEELVDPPSPDRAIIRHSKGVKVQEINMPSALCCLEKPEATQNLTAAQG